MSTTVIICIALMGILLFGLGGLTGLVAVAMGAVAIRQIRRRPGLRGNGRAIGAIVVGTSAAVVGLPVLLLLLLGVAGVIALL